MNHTELRGRDVGCVLGLGADRLWDRSSFLPLLLLLLLLSAPRQQQQPPPQQQQQPAGRRSALRRPGAPGCCPSEEDTTTATTHALVPGRSSNTRANGFYSWSCARPQNQGMDISELEFVQIIIILLVMTLMVVLIICLLSHYWLPALAFLSRLGHAQRDQATQLDGAAWPDSVLAQRNAEVMHGHLSSSLPPFMQQQRLCRLQPTYPYLPQELINLPPLICLSDGEELLPYKGPCRLQLRPLEQQLELSRAAVRAPPNRTVFDRDLIDIYTHNNKNPRAPSSNSGLNAARAMMEDPPPSYSTVMGDYTGSTDQYSQYSNNTPPPTEDRSGPESTAEASSDLKS